MAKITKSLSSKVNKDTGKAEIMFRFVYGNGKAIRARSGLHVKPIKWSTKGELKTAGIDKADADFKGKLEKLCTSIINAFTDTDKELITKEWLETVIDKHHFPEKYTPAEPETEKPITLLQYIDGFILRAPKRKHRETGRLLSPNNIQQYRATQKHVEAFANSIRKKDFEFADINQKFYNKFVTHLQGLGFTQNSVGKHIRVLKLMLNEAPKELKQVANYEKFHVFTEETDTVYLNEKELQQLKDAEFGEAHYLDRVRDWFLLLAWTGSRFSDLEKIGKTDIKDGFISFRQQKTGTKVVIPLHPVVMEVLQKYDFDLPEPISNQRFNEYIKEACKVAKIDSNESVTVTVGGVKQTTTQPKYELVSSHTGRRSFATNMYESGLPSLTIMAITGHKTEKSFLKYIKTTPEKHAKMMAEAWAKMYNQNEKGGSE